MDNQGYFGRSATGAPAPSAATTAATTPQHRPGTPNTDGQGRNPFGDGVESQASIRSNNLHNPFASPGNSRPPSSYGSSSARETGRYEAPGQRYFHSRRVRKEDIQKPWLEKKDPKEKWVTILPIVGILIGLGISGFLVWDGYRSVIQNKYCLVLDDDFSKGIDSKVWTKEVEVGGYGNGQFEWTTGDDENVFVQDGKLVIRPTLTDASYIEKDTVVDLLKDGTCTSDVYSNCVTATNTTTGNATIVQPTRSGRIHTKGGAQIKYGRVEVTAKLPKGDWLWPAIWMLPEKDNYGPWPASGEIDILESRGNNWEFKQGGNNIASSALHWGPDPGNDAWWRTNNKRQALKTTYADKYHTFGLEWNEKYLFTYINSRLLQVLYTNFDESLWKRGGFPEANANGTRLNDIWSQTGRKNTPFDTPFYLILNVAVGGTNGWFEDGQSGKPWLDGSPNAKKDFWDARDTWLPTWTDRDMQVSRVAMWQQCNGDEGMSNDL
ncbi:gram-negative bacteria-binding protein [Plectosphaerella cucumerina]|uniref:Gram-negative bacteria-binding protein n=1 Tax=Plectosphaerella cucumerina TaxID=40658 RepID=A0A8K0X360_9PEZI|nr:gram-negative bacteria-binding protein [Plectosphaerella cucumerina]